MLAIEVFIFVFAVILIVVFAIIVNPPNSLVNLLGGKKEDTRKDKPQ